MTYVRDRWISAQLETELLLDMAVLHINYDIETVNGVVYLIGIVQEEGELARVVGHPRLPARPATPLRDRRAARPPRSQERGYEARASAARQQ